MMEKFETSLSRMEHKLVNKISTLENNVSAALSNIEGRLESLEGQSLTNFSRVRNFCEVVGRFQPEFLVLQLKQTGFFSFSLKGP